MHMLTYQLLSPEQVTTLYQTHMQKDFPPAELKPLAVLHRLMEQGVYAPYGWFDQSGTLVAYSFFGCLPQGHAVVLDYLAVCQQYRDHGYGSQCLAQISVLWPKHTDILAEVEDPAKSASAEEKIIRERRVAFYQRNGMQVTGLYAEQFGVPYLIYRLPLEKHALDDKMLRQELDALYHVLYPEPLYGTQVRLWLTGDMQYEG